MLDSMRLYWRYVGASFRSQMQYRASFVMQVIGQFVIQGIEFVGVWALFSRFGSLQGWSLSEIAVLYGIVNCAYAITDATSRGFDAFAGMVRSGNFDRLLLRPRTAAFQLAAQELTTRRLGRFSQGLAVLIYGAVTLDLAWTPARLALLIFATFGASALFYGLLVLQATLAFWTTESLEIMNIVTYGGVQTARYPIVIYHEWFRRFFTYVVPLACVTYFPAVAILGRADVLGTPRWFQCAAPLIGWLFLAASLQVWKVGVRHYRSTGS